MIVEFHKTQHIRSADLSISPPSLLKNNNLPLGRVVGEKEKGRWRLLPTAGRWIYHQEHGERYTKGTDNRSVQIAEDKSANYEHEPKEAVDHD